MMVVNSKIDFLLTYSPIAVTLTVRKPEDKKVQITAVFLDAPNRIAKFLKNRTFYNR